MVSFYILAGGYSSAIVTYLFNNETSSLSLVGQYPSGQNPSWIELSPFNRSVLYATNENEDGAVQSFTVSPQGVLSSPISTISSGGSIPAHLHQLSNGKLAVMNYVSATGIVVDASPDKVHFGSPQVLSFAGNPSHPHMAYEYGSELLVPDLGQDKIWRLGQSHHGGDYSIHGIIPQPAGSGPRHIAISRGLLYTLHETTSTLSVQLMPPAPNGTSTITSSVSIVPSGAPSGATWAAAEILIPPTSPSFPKEYIYASNRNTGTPDPRGDTIAVLSRSRSGKLSVVRQVYTGLNQVRGMQFSNDGKYLIAGSASGGSGVAVFKRVDGGAGLQLVARNTEQSQKITFVWL